MRSVYEGARLQEWRSSTGTCTCSHSTNVCHAPVTSRTPIAMSSTPPTRPIALRVAAQPRRRGRHPLGRERRDEERDTQAEAVDEGEHRPAQRGRARRWTRRGRGSRQRRPDAGRPAEREGEARAAPAPRPTPAAGGGPGARAGATTRATSPRRRIPSSDRHDAEDDLERALVRAKRRGRARRRARRNSRTPGRNPG